MSDKSLSEKDEITHQEIVRGNIPRSASKHTNKKKKKSRHGHDLVPQPSDDKRDPLNWALTKKITVFGVMCFATFCGTASATANVLATTVQAEDWQVTPSEAAYSISAVLAGFVVGPILVAPLVRIIGVMSCTFWSQVIITIIGIWSALSTGPGGYDSFVASRAIAGLFSVTGQTFTTGVIADTFFIHQRGRAMAVYSTTFLIASVAGPTFSGFVVQYADWPVVFWWTVGANALAGALVFLLGDDTSWDRENDKPWGVEPLPSSWMGKRFYIFFPGTRVSSPGRKESINKSFRSMFLIFFSPVTILAGIYSLIAFGWFIMAGVQVPILLQEPVEAGGYGFDAQATAFWYFAAWIGALVGVAYGILLNDNIPMWLQRRNGGVWHPEYRLHSAWFPGLVVGPIGAGIFGASAYYHLHYIALAVGEGFLVFGATACIPPSVNYIIEIFKSYPQEVGTTLNFYRISFSIAVQFFYASWVEKIGVNWVWGTAAFLNIFGFLLVLILMVKGPIVRSWSLLADEAIADEQVIHDGNQDDGGEAA